MDISGKVDRFRITSDLQDKTPGLRVENACPHGCSPKPFVLLSDGEMGLTFEFNTRKQLAAFQAAVAGLQFGRR